MIVNSKINRYNSADEPFGLLLVLLVEIGSSQRTLNQTFFFPHGCRVF